MTISSKGASFVFPPFKTRLNGGALLLIPATIILLAMVILPALSPAAAAQHLDREKQFFHEWHKFSAGMDFIAFLVVIILLLVFAAGFILLYRLGVMVYRKWHPQPPSRDLGLALLIGVFLLYVAIQSLIFGLAALVLPFSAAKVSPEAVFVRDQVVNGLGGVLLIIFIIFGIYRARKLNLADYGFRETTPFWNYTAPLLGLGAILVFDFVAVWIMQRLGLISSLEDVLPGGMDLNIKPWAISVFFFNGVVIAPLAEEITFRSFYLSGFREYWGVWGGILASSLLFAFIHFQWALLVPLTFNGMVLGYLYCRSKSLIPSTLTHFLNNLLFFLVHSYKNFS